MVLKADVKIPSERSEERNFIKQYKPQKHPHSMLHISTLLKHYKRPEIQKAMLTVAEDREVALRYEETFGRRPDTLTYPNDILEAVKQGATSFHVSEERWYNVMQLSTGMRRQELDTLRKGWDLVLDIDCILWDYSKLIAHLIVRELKAHGIRSVTAKFSGNKGFHIAVPFEAFPQKVHGQPLPLLFPEGVRRIALYLVEKIKPKLLLHIKQHDSFENIAAQLGISQQDLSKTICGSCKKYLKEQKTKIEFVCLSCETQEEAVETEKVETEKFRICRKCSKIMEKVETLQQIRCPYCKGITFQEELDLDSLLKVDTVLISSRHLYRMPYSLHEKSGLCSVPLDPDNILQFDRSMAKPEMVTVCFPFLSPPPITGEATDLLLQAFDYLPVVSEEQNPHLKHSFSESEEETLQQAIPADFFPPCMKAGLNGLSDGKKRFLFVVMNFLTSCGYGHDAIEVLLDEWNKKNPEQLREVLLKGHLRYAQQHPKKILPPNCDNQGYYKDMGICKPDGICAKIKNPVQYAKRKAFLANLQEQRKGEKEENKIIRDKLTEEQKEMRRQFREKVKGDQPKNFE